MASLTTHDLGNLKSDVSNSCYTRDPINPLLSIPCEIRDEICAYLLRAGDLAILRTSKKICDEARERLYRENFFSSLDMLS